MGELIRTLQDLSFLDWSKTRNSSGTGGTLLKSVIESSGKRTYYKMSSYNGIEVYGHEAVNEFVVDRLLSLLGIEYHASYSLMNSKVVVDGRELHTFVCCSDSFRAAGESKIALDRFYDLECRPGETVLDFCVRLGFSQYIYKMFVVDYLILNRDRHGANIELTRSADGREIRPAPLFDHGLSLLSTCTDEDSVKTFDVLKDRTVNNYVGTTSTLKNLELIPNNCFPDLRPLKETDRYALLSGLDEVISQDHQDKIWEMIWKRWCVYEDFRNKRAGK